MRAAGRLKPGSREKRHTHRHRIRRQAGQGERVGNQAEESEERGETVSFRGPVSRPQDRAELSGSSPPSLPGLVRISTAEEECQRAKAPEQMRV